MMAVRMQRTNLRGILRAVVGLILTALVLVQTACASCSNNATSTVPVQMVINAPNYSEEATRIPVKITRLNAKTDIASNSDADSAEAETSDAATDEPSDVEVEVIYLPTDISLEVGVYQIEVLASPLLDTGEIYRIPEPVSFSVGDVEEDSAGSVDGEELDFEPTSNDQAGSSAAESESENNASEQTADDSVEDILKSPDCELTFEIMPADEVTEEDIALAKEYAEKDEEKQDNIEDLAAKATERMEEAREEKTRAEKEESAASTPAPASSGITGTLRQMYLDSIGYAASGNQHFQTIPDENLTGCSYALYDFDSDGIKDIILEAHASSPYLDELSFLSIKEGAGAIYGTEYPLNTGAASSGGFRGGIQGSKSNEGFWYITMSSGNGQVHAAHYKHNGAGMFTEAESYDYLVDQEPQEVSSDLLELEWHDVNDTAPIDAL